MTKVTTSHGGQVEHQARRCARVNGKDADHPVVCSVAPVQVPEGKQKCPDGMLHLYYAQQEHLRIESLALVTQDLTKYLDNLMRSSDSNITQNVNRYFGIPPGIIVPWLKPGCSHLKRCAIVPSYSITIVA